MNRYLSADLQLGPKGGFQGFGPLGLEGGDLAGNSGNVFQQIISSTIGIITVIAVVWFVVQLLTGAIGIMASGGDKGKTEQARAKITSALTGLVVVIAGVFITGLIGTLLGFPDILNISELITNLRP